MNDLTVRNEIKIIITKNGGKIANADNNYKFLFVLAKQHGIKMEGDMNKVAINNKIKRKYLLIQSLNIMNAYLHTDVLAIPKYFIKK